MSPRCPKAYALYAVLTMLQLSYSESGLNCNKAFYGNYGHRGVITSYNFPFDYRHNLTCINRIFIPPPVSNESRRICFVFKSFFMEISSPYCSFDSLIIGETSKNKYCGRGLWHYGLEQKGNSLSNVWSQDFCWKVESGSTFDVTFSTDNSVNGTGFMALYEVFSVPSSHASSSSSSPSSSASSSSPSSLPQTSGHAPCRAEEWTCAWDRKCIPTSRLCDGRRDCTDGSDETFAFARCKGQQNFMSCDFSNDGATRNFCNLTQEGWEIVSSQESGLADHTNGSYGHYIRTTSSSAQLMGPQTSLLPNSSYCLRFWYLLSGNLSHLFLSAYIMYDQAGFRPEWFINPDTMPAYSGHQYRGRKGTKYSQDWDGSGWRMAEIVVDLKSSSFQFLLVARREVSAVNQGSPNLEPVEQKGNDGRMKHGGGAVVALDDISLLEGPCSGVDMQCNFESSTCGWSSELTPLQHSRGRIQPGYVWKVRHSREVHGVSFDPSSFDGSGYFAAVSFPELSSSSSSSSFTREERGLFVSPGISAFPNDELCFIFSYRKFHRNTCHLNVLKISYEGHLSGALWSEEMGEAGESGDPHAGSKDYWVQAKVNITADGPFKIIFDASRSEPFESCVIAVDMIRLDRQLCIPSCMSNEFQCMDRSCIPAEMRCDGKADCDDVSDEDPSTCYPKNNMSHADQSTLLSSSNCDMYCDDNVCIYKKWVCDKISDCLDGADEASCYEDNLSSLPDDQSVEESIHLELDDEDDEDGNYPTDECPPMKFTCLSNGKCIDSSSVCDSVQDCIDGSDEDNCTMIADLNVLGCPPEFLVCIEGHPCVTREMFCDGQVDCPDASDELEMNCIKIAESGGRAASVIIGAICAIVLVLFITVLVVVCFVVAKKRQKRCHSRRRPNLPPPTMTSIATIFNSPDSQNHAPPSYHANQQKVPPSNSSMTYDDDSMRFQPDEPPPSYDPGVQQQTFQPSGSFERLDFNPEQHVDSRITGNFVGNSVASHQVQVVPTKSGGTLKRREASLKDRLSSNGDHIYEEPSGLVALMSHNASQPQDECGSRLSPGLPGRSMIPMHQSRNPRSSIVSPTASSATCQRVSRIRLGTTSLHPRAGSVEGGWATGSGAVENRGHATMGRPTRNHHHPSVVAGRRRSGGIDVERTPSSPATPPPFFGEHFISSDLNRVVGSGIEEMMMQVASKSSTPADSSNSSNSGSSNTRLLPSSASCQQFLTAAANNNLHGRKNQKLINSGRQAQVDRIPLGIGYSSDQQPFSDVFSSRHHNDRQLLTSQQLRGQKLSSTPSPHTNSFQQRHLMSNFADSYEAHAPHRINSNKQALVPNGTSAKSRLKQDSFDEPTPSSPLLQHHVICGDEFLNPTCV